MDQGSLGASTLVRVTVTSGTRSVDLALPGAVPVAELVPELARSVGLLDPTGVHAGHRLVTAGGRELGRDIGLLGQGVEDGGLLTVVAGLGPEPPRVYDDVVEAMADVVERDLGRWAPESGRAATLGAAGLLAALGAAALLVERGSVLAAATAGPVAGLLLVGAVVLSRVRRQSRAAVVMASTGSAYAALAGLLVVGDGPLLGLPVAGAGAGALLAGLLSVLALGEGRILLIAPALVGAVLLTTCLVARAVSVDPAAALTAALVLVVLAGGALPSLALAVTGTTAPHPGPVADVAARHVEIDPVRVAADMRMAHEILVAVSAATGLLLVLVAPPAVSLGRAGTGVTVLACVLVLLRTRSYRSGLEVLVGVVSGVLGLASVGVSVLWLHPDWRPATAVVLAATGVVLLSTTLLPGTPSVRRAYLGDIVESAALLALLPVLVVAVGLFAAIRG